MSVDRRLVWNQAYHCHTLRGLVYARKIERNSWAAAAREALATCLKDSFADAAVEVVLKDVRPKIPDAEVDKFQALFDRSDTQHTQQQAWLVGLAIADILCMDGTDVNDFEALWHIIDDGLFEAGYHALMQRLQSNLENEKRKSHFCSLLEETARQAGQDIGPYSGYTHEADIVQQAQADFIQATDAAVMWREDQRATYVLPKHLGAARALRTIDRHVFLSILDKLNSPELVRHFLSFDEIRTDFDELLALLAEAPSAFENGEERIWTKSVTAGLVLECALRHVDELHRAEVAPTPDDPKWDQSEEFDRNEATPLLTRLMDVLKCRPDFKELGITLLCHLVHKQAIFHQNASWQALQCAAELLGGILGEAHISLDDFLHVRSFDRLSRSARFKMLGAGTGDQNTMHPQLPNATDMLLAACLCRKDNSTLQAKDLMELLEEILVRRNWGLRVDIGRAPPTWRHHQIALLLASSEAPGEQFARLWHGLYAQRRRADAFTFTNDSMADDASQFVAILGLGTVDWMLSAESVSQPNTILQFWAIVWECIVSYCLQTTGLHTRTWWRFAELHVARLPYILAHLPSSDHQGVFKQLARSLGGDTPSILGVVNLLRLNSADPKIVSDAFTVSGVNLHETLSDLKDWEERDGGARSLMPREFEALLSTLSWCAGTAR